MRHRLIGRASAIISISHAEIPTTTELRKEGAAMERMLKCGLMLLLIAGAGLTAGGTVHAQHADHTGTDFFVGFMPQWDQFGGMTTELHLISDYETEVTVHHPAIDPTFVATVTLTPGEVSVVDLGAEPAFGWTPGLVDNNAVHIFADQAFAVHAINRRSISTDAALALPVDALGTEYIVQTYVPFHRFSVFAIVAAHDNTTVTITPTRDLEGGFATGESFQVELDRGEGFLGQSAESRGPDGDLTGTIILSSMPVQVSNGNGCTLVPQFIQSCDHLFEIAQPVSVWGTTAFAAPVPERPSGSVYRILASEDDTVVRQDGAVVATLDRGAFHETPEVPGAPVFASDKPIFVTQFITGNSSPETEFMQGDPSMGSVLPAEQYLTRYTFSTLLGEQFARHYVSVIALSASVPGSAVFLDGTPIPAAEFEPIDGTEYSYAVLAIEEGMHTTASEHPHGVTVVGYHDFDSYLFAPGATFRRSVTTTTPPILPSIALDQNYPNPTRDATRIDFRLADSGPVSLVVYDLLGRRIATLVHASLHAGHHSVSWDTTDPSGRRVPGGIYLYRLETANAGLTRQMVVMP
jgi:hypothetical protein